MELLLKTVNNMQSDTLYTCFIILAYEDVREKSIRIFNLYTNEWI